MLLYNGAVACEGYSESLTYSSHNPHMRLNLKNVRDHVRDEMSKNPLSKGIATDLCEGLRSKCEKLLAVSSK